MRHVPPARDPSRARLATDPTPQTTSAPPQLCDILLRATIGDAASPFDSVVLPLAAGLPVPLDVSVRTRDGGRLTVPMLVTLRNGEMSIDIVGEPPCLCRIAPGAASACLSRPASPGDRGAA